MKQENQLEQMEQKLQTLISQAKQARAMNNTTQLQMNLTRIYRMIKPPLTRFVMQFAFLSAAQKEEVVSETFLRAFSGLDAYKQRQNAKFISWLLKISRNLAYDYWKVNKRKLLLKNSVSLDELIMTSPAAVYQPNGEVKSYSALTPEYQMLSEEVTSYYHQILLELNPIDVQILYWRTDEQLTHREIADRLTGVHGKSFSETMVRQRFHRSKMRLKQQISHFAIVEN